MTSKLGTIKEQKSRAPSKEYWKQRAKDAKAKAKKKFVGGKGYKAIESALAKRGDTTFNKKKSPSSSLKSRVSSAAKTAPKAAKPAAKATKTTWQQRKTAAKAAKSQRQATRAAKKK